MHKFLLTLALLLPAAGFAQTYSIDWSSIGGGGGASTGGAYSISGTLGQPDANPQPITGGNFSITGGFWSLSDVPQTAGPPLLAITLTSTNTVMVSWLSPSPGFNLQQNINGLDTANWSNVVTAPFDNGVIKYLIVNPPTGTRFFRLTKP